MSVLLHSRVIFTRAEYDALTTLERDQLRADLLDQLRFYRDELLYVFDEADIAYMERFDSTSGEQFVVVQMNVLATPTVTPQPLGGKANPVVSRIVGKEPPLWTEG